MADDEPKRFRVIEGGDAPKRYRAKAPGRYEMLTCSVCERDIGTATAMSMEVRQGRMLKDLKPQGGTKTLICVHCLARGKVTVLI